MNRSEIVDELAAKFGNLTKSDTELAINVDFHANLTPVFHSILTPPVAV